MLLNLKTIHQPETIEEAVRLLNANPTIYPLYGGAALQRASRPDVEAAVSLDRLDLSGVEDANGTLSLGAMLTLEETRQVCAEWADRSPALRALAELLAADYPETLRNTFTVGDFLIERDPQSLAMTLLLALGAMIERVDVEIDLTMAAWFAADDVMRYLVADLRVPIGSPDTVIAHEKVARTPADAPIVAAVAVRSGSQPDQRPRTTLALCAVAERPVRQPETAQIVDAGGALDDALDSLALNPFGDHWGSAEYRAAMARVVSRRVLERVLDAG